MSDISRAGHWRQRAEELRTIADGTHETAARSSLIAVADDLDRMAERLERGAKPEDSPTAERRG
ncbi:MAG: hypothetical protein JWL84_4495 [Rhodospirillales bacterium]|jgi:hypothetical protein|nr:hypothetical protein [Rhodospirillales bacterium]